MRIQLPLKKALLMLLVVGCVGVMGPKSSQAQSVPSYSASRFPLAVSCLGLGDR